MSDREKKPVAVAVARRLRAIMAARNMTSADLMRSTGCGSGQISGYLNGYFVMRIDVLIRLCKELDCSSDYLLGLSNTPKGN